MRQRRALAALASAVDIRAAQRAGIEVDAASAETEVAEALAALHHAGGWTPPGSIERA